MRWECCMGFRTFKFQAAFGFEACLCFVHELRFGDGHKRLILRAHLVFGQFAIQVTKHFAHNIFMASFFEVGLHDLGWHLPYDAIKDAAYAVSSGLESGKGFVKWLVTAGLDGVIGLIAGLVLIPIVTRMIIPVAGRLFPEKA